jgi:hypothetical protein
MRTYLAATLPVCALGQTPPFSLEGFLAQCAEVLTINDRQEVESIVLNRLSECRTAFGRAWSSLKMQMDEEITILRAQKWQIPAPPSKMYSGYSLEVRRLVHEAFDRETPLQVEWTLDQGRWSLGQGLIPPDRPLGLERILSFALQLQIMHRWAAMDADTGDKRLTSLLEDSVSKALAERAYK